VGKGLGVKFLRHIQRTKVLVHCISLESLDPQKDYAVIRKELENYSPDLVAKKEIILLTKTDLADEKAINKTIKKMQKLNPDVAVVSIHDEEKLLALKKSLITMLEK